MPSASPSEGRIGRKFRELQARKEGTLIAYLTGGDPDPKSFLKNCDALVEGGADIVEVGIPFSDPIADGPVIQASSQRALVSGTRPTQVLELAKEVTEAHNIPVVILSYYNPILAIGPERFLQTAKETGVDGIVVPDLPLEESAHFSVLAEKYGLDNVLLAAPNTTKPRLLEILRNSKGFLYLVSLYGVTGPRQTISPLALETVKRTKALAASRIPVAAGFGISNPDHVTSLLKSGADGAIVGSALVEIVSQHLDDPEVATSMLREKVSNLKSATRLGL